MSQPASSFDFRAAIENAIAAFEKAAIAKDAVAIANMYTEDATLLPPGSPAVKGRQNILTFWQSFFDAGASDAVLQVVEVGTSGDMAYEIGAFEASLPGPQGIARTQGKYVVVWKRQADGSIKLAADIFNANS